MNFSKTVIPGARGEWGGGMGEGEGMGRGVVKSRNVLFKPAQNESYDGLVICADKIHRLWWSMMWAHVDEEFCATYCYANSALTKPY